MNKKLIMLVSVSLLLSGMSYAKVKDVRSRNDFDQSVKEGKVVVLCYENNTDLMSMYESVSRVGKYSDIMFLSVDVTRPGFSNLATVYRIRTMPTFIFFYNGKHLIDPRGGAVNTASELKSRINHHYSAEESE